MIPILTPSEMAGVDAASPHPVEVLVERAGAAVAREAVDLLGGTYGRRVAVIAGKGNNGADGRAAARRLASRGVRVTVIPAEERTPDAPGRAVAWNGLDLVIDAAYGTGMRGDYHAPQVGEVPVLAVDIPSGIDGTTGRRCGTPLRAVRTVTFAALKPGLLLGDGPEWSGEVRVADIGLDVDGVAAAHLVEGTDLGRMWPRRPATAHKWQSPVWVVAGSPHMTGAARLCCRAAARAGAGYVRRSVPGSAPVTGDPVEAVDWNLPAVGWADDVAAGLARIAAVCVGPGLAPGSDTLTDVTRLLTLGGPPKVVDGTALAVFGATVPIPLGSPTVVTPHDGEFDAITGGPPDVDRFAAARSLAAGLGATVLLKGPTTVVADPQGRVLVSSSGDDRLATAGSGDVLAGVITALLARGLEPLEAAALGAWWHGAAATHGHRHGLVAGDLPDLLPGALEVVLADAAHEVKTPTR